MRINCLVQDIKIKQGKIILSPDTSHHLARVLRIKEDQEITIFDGKGNIGYSEAIEINKNAVIINVLRSEFKSRPDIEIELFQAIPKLERWDTILQKSVELGVSKIHPLISKHTEYKKSNDKSSRWKQIIRSAAEQSASRWLPELSSIQNLSDVLCNIKSYDLALVGSLYSPSRLFKEINWNNAKKVALIIGPEGDFSQEEINLIISNHGIPVSFGEQILRTETAAIFGLSVIKYELR